MQNVRKKNWNTKCEILTLQNVHTYIVQDVCTNEKFYDEYVQMIANNLLSILIL